jgi:hypothetical protein
MSDGICCQEELSKNGWDYCMRFLKDLLFTDKYLIKGHVKTGGQRLSTFLNNTRKRFLEMEEATLTKHDGSDRISSESVLVKISDVLFAHEMEETGDEVLRNLGVRDRDELLVHFHLSSDASMQISGMVRQRTLDSDIFRKHDFIVMMRPALKGFAANPAPEFDLLNKASYLIVNLDRISIIFQ